jgi:WD40 repeat protein
MNQPPQPFYIVGGSIPGDALSYVERQADDDLYLGLQQGEFCYVLTARQMGKSSLMVHTVARLREAQSHPIKSVVLDLSALGRNLTLEQWYASLRDRIGRQLDLEDEMKDFWDAHQHLSPLQRWMEALRQIILERYPGQIVIFIDEIDFVRSLPFDTDEFFAAIRSCYNRRTEDAAFLRLTFCLLGVASPAELIRDPNMTPFNIGRRIELDDFTLTQAHVLAFGLHTDQKTARRLLARVLYWTGGHPYLTQKLCQALARTKTITEEGVDSLCREQFLSSKARVGESNLAFVTNRFLNSGQDIASLLELYLKVWNRQRVLNDETSRLVSALNLSGIVRAEEGRLLVRNRIYAQVFDRSWIRRQMPDAEIQRQKAAYRRGVWRSALAITMVLAVVSSLAAAILMQRRDTRSLQQADRYRQAITRLEASEQRSKLALYGADMVQAQQNWEEGNITAVRRLLANHYPEQDRGDRRDFEWRYLWRLLHQDRQTLSGHAKIVFCLAYGPDGNTIATGGWDRTPIVWNAHTGEVVARLPKQAGVISALAFSPHGDILTIASSNATQGSSIALWDTANRKILRSFSTAGTFIESVVFSHNGRLLAARTTDLQGRNIAYMWNSLTGEQRWRSWVGTEKQEGALAFSADDHLLGLTGGKQGKPIVLLWNTLTQRVVRTLPGPSTPLLYSLAFSADGKHLAVGNGKGDVYVWETTRWRLEQAFHESTQCIHSLAFSADSTLLAAASWDYTIHLWSVPNWKQHWVLKGHSDRVNAVAFSPDGKTLASVSSDKTTKLWSVSDITRGDLPQELQQGLIAGMFFSNGSVLATCPLPRDLNPPSKMLDWHIWDTATFHHKAEMKPLADTVLFALSPDKRTIALHVPEEPVILLKDFSTNRTVRSLPISKPQVGALCFSPDGASLAGFIGNAKVQLWNIATGKGRLLCPRPVEAASSHSFMRYSSDGRFLAVEWEARQNWISIWDIERGCEIETIKGLENSVLDIAFSSDNRYVAISDWAGPVVIWDMTIHKEIRRLIPHKPFTQRLAFSHDDKTLVTGGVDGNVKLWNTQMWQEIARFPGKEGCPVTACAFSQNDTQLMSITREGVHVWKAASWAEIEAREYREGRLSSEPN